MQPESHWKERAMTSSEAITDAWDVTKAILARLAEWVLFLCMVMNIIEILPGVVLPALVSNLVLCVQAVTLDVAGFGLASMADHARDNGDEAAARTGKRTSWLLISLMVVTLLLVSIGLLWPQTQTFTAPAEKVLILARVIMTVIYSHVVHSLRRSTHTSQVDPTGATLDYAELARQLHAQFPQPASVAQLDYQELIQQLVPLLPAPQVDRQAITEQLKSTCQAIIHRELAAFWAPLAGTEHGAGASLGSGSQSHVLALGPPARATFPSHLVAPASGTGVTRQSHLPEPEPLTRATRRSHLAEPVSCGGAIPERPSEPPTGATEERLQVAYQELTAEGGRVSGRALAARARCNRASATAWLQRQAGGSGVDPELPAETTPERPSEPVEASA